MSDLRTAALRALEALEWYRQEYRDIDGGTRFDWTDSAVDDLRAALEDNKVDSQAIAKQPSSPPEAQTEAEKIAYCAGWWAAMEEKRS